ncbi:MAG: hypothetical protein HYY93_08225 [Planctomycetes bacterium]|nr:hypothetical protein [Planctomycetota bacterium]
MDTRHGAGFVFLLVFGAGTAVRAEDDLKTEIASFKQELDGLQSMLTDPAAHLDRLTRLKQQFLALDARPDLDRGSTNSWRLSQEIGKIEAAFGEYDSAVRRYRELLGRLTDKEWVPGTVWFLWKYAVRSGDPKLLKEVAATVIEKDPEGPMATRLVREKGPPYAGLIGKPAKRLAGKDVGGRAVNLGAMKGKLVIVHFWGTW